MVESHHALAAPIESDKDFLVLHCATCNQSGRELSPGAHFFETDDARPLRDARYTPTGQWVCCQPCLSQAMYEHATEQEQKDINRYQHALTELMSVSPEIQEHLKAWGCYSEVKPLSLSIAQYALGVNERRWVGIAQSPAWVEANQTPEAILRFAASMAARDLQFCTRAELRACVDLQELMVTARPKTPHDAIAPQTILFLNKALRAIDGIISRLAGALAGEVRI